MGAGTTGPEEPTAASDDGPAASDVADAAERPVRAPLHDAEPDDTVVVPSLDDGRTVVLPLPADPVAVGKARAFVAAKWSWLDQATLADISLIVSELVSNAVRHGRPEIELRLRVEPLALDVAVLDHGPGDLPATVEPVSPTAQGGRGLAVVDTLANFWGVEPAADSAAAGKVVWASLSRPR